MRKSTVTLPVTLSISVILAVSLINLMSRPANSGLIVGVVTAVLIFLVVVAFLITFFGRYKSKYIPHNVYFSCIKKLRFV